jgi:hypothetical protein
MKSKDVWKLWASIVIPLALAAALSYRLRDAIANLIALMPHPELLWTIFSAMAFGLLLVLIAAWTVGRELRWAKAWELADERTRKALWPKLDRQSAVAGVYNLLTGSRNRVSDNYKEALGAELKIAEERLFAKASFASFVSGLLVGLGLLGTFIGLLGAIEDIARLISSLTIGGNENLAALFGELVRRLKDPMRSMGTAFTASLFGLLGSLFLSYLCLMIRRGALQVIVNLRAMIRRADVFLQLAETRTYEDHLDIAVREATQWHALFEELRGNYTGILQDSAQTQIGIRALVESNQQLASDLRERDAATHQVLFDELRNINREALHESQRTQSDMRALIASNQLLVEGMRERSETDQLIRRLLGEGVHWADALERVVEQTGRMRTETVGASARVVESIRSLEATALRAGERQPVVQDELRSALALIAGRVGKLSQTLETQAQSVATYSEALLDSLQSHQLAIDANNDKMRALLAAAIDSKSDLGVAHHG